MTYLKWHEKTIIDFSDATIEKLYSEGFLFGRTGKGEMYETRSVRIDLSRFELSSENRRVLRKTEGVELQKRTLPYAEYHWSIGKLGKDFYTQKFGDGTFSANKIKEIMTDADKSNFNSLLMYTYNTTPVGYAICVETANIIHYCYPFYDLESAVPNLGLGMMTKAIAWAKENQKKYVYLGSFSRPTDTYKLQFEGLEWWDGSEWKKDAEELKIIRL